MQRSLLFSIVFHGGVFALAIFGLPYIAPEPRLLDEAITVEILNVDEKTNAPEIVPDDGKKPEQKTVKKAEPEIKTPPPPPPPPPKKASAPDQPEPEALPEKKAEPAPVKAEVKPKIKPKPKPKPKKIEPKKVEIKKSKFANTKPRRKPKRKHRPKPPDQFASVLKTLEKLKNQPKSKKKIEDKPKEKVKPKTSFQEQMAKALASPSKSFNAEQSLAISEIDLVRQQIRKCWSLPAGAKDAADLVISIEVDMNADGSVRRAQIKDRARMGKDAFFRAAAESARRAVLNPRCNPFKLPPEKYQQWQTMTLNFNPREMF